jgi:hypothetical protein
MVNIRTRNGNTDAEEMKAGPHIDANGQHHPPIGTFHEMLKNAQFGDPPMPWNERTQDRFLATLKAYPLFRESIRELFRGK